MHRLVDDNKNNIIFPSEMFVECVYVRACVRVDDGRWHNSIWRTESTLAHWRCPSYGNKFVGVNLRWRKSFFLLHSFCTFYCCHPFYRRFDFSRFIHKFYLVNGGHSIFVSVSGKVLLVRETITRKISMCDVLFLLGSVFLQSKEKRNRINLENSRQLQRKRKKNWATCKCSWMLFAWHFLSIDNGIVHQNSLHSCALCFFMQHALLFYFFLCPVQLSGCR